MNKAISIIIVDDHPLFRQGVVDALSLEENFLVVAEASDGDEGLRLIRGIRPMVAIVDVNLPELNGQQLTRQVVSEKVSTRILLLTAYDDSEQKIHAMRVGAAGYCTKDVQPETLVANIKELANGRFVIGDQVLDQKGIEEWLICKTGQVSRVYSDPGEPYLPLSSREMEVLEFVTQGLSNKEIAISLNISHQTVKNHVTAILRKLGVEDRTQAAIFALRRGWVRLYEQDTEITE
ncbi:MAG TPA: response regulator transcription factor [Anaerolineales bacterium]|nr:response regulator transcription factor [Anaerolineales bacterium]